MGLDMYLFSFPNNGMSPTEISKLNYKLGDFVSDDGTVNMRRVTPSWLKQNGVGENNIASAIEMIRGSKATYADWDKERIFPNFDFKKEEAYWRKANAIHGFFVDHGQGGEDDCAFHDPIEPETLELLRDKCLKVLATVRDEDGNPVTSKTILDRNPWEYHYIVSEKLAQKELETMGGFCFGSVDYDASYIYNIAYTVDVMNKLLDEFDFENRRLYYVSSW